MHQKALKVYQNPVKINKNQPKYTKMHQNPSSVVKNAHNFIIFNEIQPNTAAHCSLGAACVQPARPGGGSDHPNPVQDH